MPPKRRRRFQGLYYHSTPPKVMSLNGQAAGNQNGRVKRANEDYAVKLSTIRIWMHEKEIGKLTRLLWVGQGHRLSQQASNNARVKRFLAAVPHVMVNKTLILDKSQPLKQSEPFQNDIRNLHRAVIDNNLETLQAQLEPPVPAALASCRDSNGLNLIHKAAGLGHTKILEFLVGIWPEGVQNIDISGKTPLHWAASAKNNMRCYTLLTQAGCDEEALDYKMKTPTYYRHKPHEIERAFLVYVPEAPRISIDSVTDWEALSDDNVSSAGDATLGKKSQTKISAPVEDSKDMPPHGDSIDNSFEVDTNDGTSINGEDDFSKTEIAPPLEATEIEMPSGGTDSEAENMARAVSNDDKAAAAAAAAAEEEADVAAEAETEAEAEADEEEEEEEAVEAESIEAEAVEAAAVEAVEEAAVEEEAVEAKSAAVEAESESEVDVDVDVDVELDPELELDELSETDQPEAIDNEILEASASDENANESDIENIEQIANGNGEMDQAKTEEALLHEAALAEALRTMVIEDAEVSLQLSKQTTYEADINHFDTTIERLATASNGQKKSIDVDEDDDEDVITATPKSSQQHSLDMQTIEQQLDELHNLADDSDSPTSSLAIEGFVQGTPEDYQVQSLTAAYPIDEARIKMIIESGDMEQLAEIVLNGEGAQLLELRSEEPEIQAFLNNVPNYMEKIHRVHEAARDGSLLSLQQALDRRKFAIAKDDISPNGATPLHVAVLFGHSDIVRYLASRFPETIVITDNDGRTALHYAATIKDNGHFYNVLLQMGGNPKALDKLGHTAEFYLDMEKSKDILTYSELLNVFGAEELEKQLLNDQVPDDLHSARRELQDGEISRTLERCFSVIQESGKLLSGMSASALAQRKPLSASTLQLSVTSYLSRFLKRPVYERIKRRQTRLDHNLFDVLWPAMRKTSKVRHLEEDINCGIIAPDFDVFVVFQEFLVPLLKDMHCLSIDADFKPQPRLAFFPMDNGERLNTAAFSFDDESHLVTRCIVEASRNLDQLELPLNLTIGQIEQAERVMMGKIFTTSFADAIGETESGHYYTLTELLDEGCEVAELLSGLGLMIPLLDTTDPVQSAESTAFNGPLWPYGRGVYVNSAHNLALWLNCQEHLRVLSASSSPSAADMGACYTRVGRAVTYLETQLHFKESYLLGYLQSRPAYLGTGLKMTTIVKLPNLMKEMDNLRHLCSVRGLSLGTNRLSTLTVRLCNMQSMGIVEYVLFQDYCTAVTNILSLEKDMSLTNSKHIATMLVKIFRRKKNSIVDRNV